MADGENTPATGDQQGQQQQTTTTGAASGQQETAAQGGQQETAGGTTATGDEQLLDGARNPDAVKNALQQERQRAREAQKRADELATRVQEFEDRDKTEQQRLEERANTAEGKATSLTAENVRLRVAIEKGLVGDHAWMVDRLQGSTKEELAADADEFLKRAGTAGASTSFDGGARGSAAGDGDDMNAQLRRMAGRT